MKMIFTGDSITANYGLVDYKEGYTSIVASKLGYSVNEWKNTAISGSTSLTILKNIDDLIISHSPEKCMIMIGTNDVLNSTYYGTSVDELVKNYIDNIKQISALLVNEGIQLTYLSPITTLTPNDNPRLEFISKALKYFCIDYGYNFIDINTAFFHYLSNRSKAEIEDWYVDLYHFNKSGHYVLSYQITKTIL